LSIRGGSTQQSQQTPQQEVRFTHKFFHRKTPIEKETAQLQVDFKAENTFAWESLQEFWGEAAKFWGEWETGRSKRS
jgi:hypothetical protein